MRIGQGGHGRPDSRVTVCGEAERHRDTGMHLFRHGTPTFFPQTPSVSAGRADAASGNSTVSDTEDADYIEYVAL